MFMTVVGALNEGFVQTLALFAVTLAGALPLGLIVSFGSMSRFTPLRWLTRTVIWVIRGTPLMLQLYIIFFIPGMVLPSGNPWPAGTAGRFMAAAVAFIINYSCYFAEIYRGGIQGVPAGQQEAGMVLGMTKSQIFFKVTLLQMVKRVVPPMSNEIITLVKDTSLAFVLGIMEMFSAAKALAASEVSMIPYAIAALIYWVFCLVIEFILNRVEKKLDYYHD